MPGKIAHDPDSKQIGLWVNVTILDKWNSFAKGFGVNRTALIITAVNEYIAQHEKSKIAEAALDTLQQQLAEAQDVVKSVQEQTTEKVRDMLAREPADSATLSWALGITEKEVLKSLKVLEAKKIVQMDKRGVYHVIVGSGRSIR
jgi:hypothetical protein